MSSIPQGASDGSSDRLRTWAARDGREFEVWAALGQEALTLRDRVSEGERRSQGCGAGLAPERCPAQPSLGPLGRHDKHGMVGRMKILASGCRMYRRPRRSPPQAGQPLLFLKRDRQLQSRVASGGVRLRFGQAMIKVGFVEKETVDVALKVQRDRDGIGDSHQFLSSIRAISSRWSRNLQSVRR